MEGLSQVNGMLLSQFVLAFIMFVAVIVLKAKRHRTSYYASNGFVGFSEREVLIQLMVAVGFLVVTPSLSASWSEMFSYKVPLLSISRETVFFLIFLSNIIITSRLVHFTGGSMGSPFQAIYFFIPTLSILLQESVLKILFYSILISLLFSVQVYWHKKIDGGMPINRAKQAYVFVSVACLFLTIAVAVLTR